MTSTKWGVALDSYSTWLKAGNRSPGTIRLRTYYLNRLACVHADPWGVTPDQLAAWLAQPDRPACAHC